MGFKQKIMRFAFSMTAIIILVITVILGLNQGPHIAGVNNFIFDERLIPALQNISKIVPKDEKIVTLTSIPIVVYFTGRDVGNSQGVSSYLSLVDVMDKESYNYLLVYENESNIPALLKLFKKKNLSYLSNNFTEIGTYTTDSNKLHLYKRTISSK